MTNGLLLALALTVTQARQPTTDTSRSPAAKSQSAETTARQTPTRPLQDTLRGHPSSDGIPTPNDIPVAQWILFVVQVGGLIGLLVYVWKTWQIAKSTEQGAQASANALEEMRRTREEASAPHVVVYLSGANRIFAEIVIENFGEGTAADVECTFDPPLQSTMGGDVGRFFSSPKWLPPKARMTHAFDSWIQYFGSSLPRRYTVSVTYKDVALAKAFCHTYVLDVAAFEYMMRWEQKDVHDLAKSLENLSKNVEVGFSKLQSRVDRWDSVWQATPSEADLRTSIAQILSSWQLLSALEEAPDAHAFAQHHFASMRKAATSAMAGAVGEAAAPDQRRAIEDVFIALHHHDFDVMTDQAPAMEKLAAAVSAIERHFSRALPPRLTPFE